MDLGNSKYERTTSVSQKWGRIVNLNIRISNSPLLQSGKPL
jgi:hypothetical protein